MMTDTHKDQLTLHGYGEVEEMGGRCGWVDGGLTGEEVEGDGGVQIVNRGERVWKIYWWINGCRVTSQKSSMRNNKMAGC